MHVLDGNVLFDLIQFITGLWNMGWDVTFAKKYTRDGSLLKKMEHCLSNFSSASNEAEKQQKVVSGIHVKPIRLNVIRMVLLKRVRQKIHSYFFKAEMRLK